jgi:nucleotide-binding universal stress UspA family protein
MQTEPSREDGGPTRQRQPDRRQLPDQPRQPDPQRQPDQQRQPNQQAAGESRLPNLIHPVMAGYDGSVSARHALAYAAGMARRMERPLLVVYVLTAGVYCEPLTGQVVGVQRDIEAIERWLLDELDQVADSRDLEVHVRTRRGRPAKELAALAARLTADALVIGAPTHFWHQAAGSVPGWLARHARCPIIVVP